MTRHMHKQQLKASRMELRPTAVHYCSYFESSFNLAALTGLLTQNNSPLFTQGLSHYILDMCVHTTC